MWYHGLSCQSVANTGLVLLGSSVPTLANMHHCPVPLSQRSRGGPAYTWYCWVLPSAPELPDARAPEQGLSSRKCLDAQGNVNATANAQMGTFKILFCINLLQIPLSQPCKGLTERKQLKCHDFKLSHSGSHLVVFMMGWGTGGFTVPKYVKVCKRVSGSNWSFPQFSQQSWIPLANTPTPTQGLGCPSHSPLPSSSSSSSAGLGCLAGQAAHTPTGRTGLFRASAWTTVFIASHRWRVHN